MSSLVLPRPSPSQPAAPDPHAGAAPAASGLMPEAGQPLELLCFRACGQEYGLPLQAIQEIRRYQAATPLPGQGAAVLGVMDLRGQVIAMLDLRCLLGLPAFEVAETELRAVVVLVHGTQRLGLVVDEVLDVLPVAADALRALPQLPGDFAQAHLRGMVSTGTRSVLLLDPSPWLMAHARA